MNAFDRFYFETMRRVIGTPHWSRWIAAVVLLNTSRVVLFISRNLIAAAQRLIALNNRIATKLDTLKD